MEHYPSERTIKEVTEILGESVVSKLLPKATNKKIGGKNMKNLLEMVNETIESMEGLEVSFKFGPESELIIRGDFMAMSRAMMKIAQRETITQETSADVRELERKLEAANSSKLSEIRDLERKLEEAKEELSNLKR